MAKSEKEKMKQLRNEARKYMMDQIAFSDKLKHERMADYFRRSQQTYRFQEKLLVRAFKKAGIDYEQIKARQQKDYEASQKLRAKHLEMVRQQSRILNKRHKKRIQKARLLRRRFERSGGNPNLTIFLCRATPVPSHGSTTGNGVHISSLESNYPDLGENILRIKVRVKTSKWGIATVFIENEFVYVSDQQANVNATGFIYATGAYDINLVSSCVGECTGSVKVTAYMSLGQNIGGGTYAFKLTDKVILDEERKISACTGVVTTDSVTPYRPDEITLEVNNFPLQQGPIVATVGFMIEVSASNDGEAVFDVKSDPSYGLNTSCISLIGDITG